MADSTPKPVIFLAFANDRDDTVGYLRNLPVEARRLREVLEPAERVGLCEVVVLQNCTAGDIFKVFQDSRYRNRVGIFHYGGHASGYELLLESPEGKAVTADAGGLAAFLSQQQGLRLVFLNGCSTQQHTQELHDANVAVVISTSRSIDDKVATDFAVQFYQGLAGGVSLSNAYNEAFAAMKTTKGADLRALYFGDADKPEDHRNESGFPWNLYPREGSENADQWNLPEAVKDPLFGLPPLPEQDLPESPYRHLAWFRREDAEVFFGRGHQIRKLYSLLTAGTQPIILFYGQSGVGKSSLLDAGLMPRLEQSCEVRYLRRRAGGLLDTLQRAFLPEASDVPFETAWLAREAQLKRPLIVFLDQVEEFYTQPIKDLPDELDQLLRVLKATFGDPKSRPQGKLVLGFRKEWLAELEAKMVLHELPRAKVSLDPLDRDGIIEVVQGPTRSARLRERYGLKVDDWLGKIIADDMLKDRGSAISTTLQILLSKMWTEATALNSESPQFTQDLYQALERDGILLGDFLDQQLEKFHSVSPDPVNSGLLLDVLALHTTDLGSARECSRECLLEVYAHVSDELPSLLRKCQDLYLLTETARSQKESTRTTRLAHDTLAPLVRDKFDKSDKPGQRARRILDNRSVDWVGDHVGTPLDEADLKLVEQGCIGTRMLNSTEQRLVTASRDLREERRRSRQAAEQQKIELLQNLAEAEREKAKEQEARAVAEQERANAQEARATTFRRMLIATGSATVVAVVLAVVAFNASNRSKQALADLKTESTKLKTESTEREAAALMAAFSGNDTTPTVREYESLRILADSDEATRLAFLNQLLNSVSKAERLRDRYHHLSHAIVGLDVEVKERVKVVLSNHGRIPADDEAINVAVARLGMQLVGDDADFDKMVAMNFVAAMEKTTDSSALTSLAGAFGRLREKLPEKEASALAREIVAAMENTTASNSLSTLGLALGSFGEKLPKDQATAGARRIVAVMENTTASNSLSTLGLALGSFGEKLPGDQATAGARQIVAAMEERREYDDLASLSHAFGSLGEKLPEKQALALAQRIVAEMGNTTDPYSLSYLGLALGSFGEKLPGDQALAGARQIVAAIENAPNDTILSSLGFALGHLGEKVAKEQTSALAHRIVAHMENTTDSYSLSTLGLALGSFGAKLPADQASAAARQIVAAMETARDTNGLETLGRALGSFGENLPREQLLSGAKQIVAAMEENTEPSIVQSLGDALTSSFGKNLPGDQAFAGAQRIVAVMEMTGDFSALSLLGSALRRLGEKLPEQHASALARRIIAAIGNMTGDFSNFGANSNALTFYGLALVSLGEKLPKEEALALAQQIVSAMEKSSGSDALGNLGLALGSLGEKLPREQALAGAQHIVTAMEKKTYSSDEATELIALGNLGLALGSLGEKLPREQALAGAQHIVTAMEKGYFIDNLVPALDLLDEKLPPAQAQALAQRILAAMEKETNGHILESLSRALGSLVKNQPGEQASVGAQRIVAAMEKTTDAEALSSLGSGLGTLAAQMEVEATCSVLKSIVCVGDSQEKVFAGLKEKTGQEFDGNLWKAVTWLEEQGIDLKNVPRFSNTRPE